MDKTDEILAMAEKTLSKKEIAEMNKYAKRMSKINEIAYKALIDSIIKELKPKSLKDAIDVMAISGSVAMVIIHKVGKFSSTVDKPENELVYKAMNLRLEQISEVLKEAKKVNNRQMFG